MPSASPVRGRPATGALRPEPDVSCPGLRVFGRGGVEALHDATPHPVVRMPETARRGCGLPETARSCDPCRMELVSVSVRDCLPLAAHYGRSGRRAAWSLLSWGPGGARLIKLTRFAASFHPTPYPSQPHVRAAQRILAPRFSADPGKTAGIGPSSDSGALDGHWAGRRLAVVAVATGAVQGCNVATLGAIVRPC